MNAFGRVDGHEGYCHPLELLSAFLCLFGCEEMLAIPTIYLKENNVAMKALRIKESEKTHVELHVVTLLTKYRAIGRASPAVSSKQSKLSKQSS